MNESDSPSPLDFEAWQLEAEPEQILDEPDVLPIRPSPPTPPPPPLPPPSTAWRPPASATETPPPPERIVEAMLFVGGPPLSAEIVSKAIRGFTPEQLQEAIDTLNRLYRGQNRPYSIQLREQGYVMVVKAEYDSVKERLLGGPREARLSQPTLDVLSLIAYRQPIAKPDIDSLRGTDSASALRQLVRLGLIAVSRRGEAGSREVGYGTTSRFLEVFSLSSLDDLPQLAETRIIS